MIANWLETIGKSSNLVRDVRYPGLKRPEGIETIGERRERELAWSQLTDGGRRHMEREGYSRDGEKGFPCGGMVSFHINSGEESKGSQTDSKVAEEFLVSKFSSFFFQFRFNADSNTLIL